MVEKDKLEQELEKVKLEKYKLEKANKEKAKQEKDKKAKLELELEYSFDSIETSSQCHMYWFICCGKH